MTPQEVPPIQPQPMPTQWGFDHTADGKFVVVAVNRPSGNDFFFLTAESIEEFVQVLKAQARHCNRIKNGDSDTGIVIPAKPIFGPDGEPIGTVPQSDEVLDMAEKMAEKRAKEIEGDNVSPFPRPVDEGDDDGPSDVLG